MATSPLNRMQALRTQATGAAGIRPEQMQAAQKPPLQESAFGKVTKSGQFSGSLEDLEKHKEEMYNRANLPGRLRDQAAGYRANLGQTQDKMMTGAGEDARRGLASNIQNIQQGSNQRGLLYSGLNQGAQQAAQSDASNQLQASRARINEQTNASADMYDQMATDTSLENQDMAMRKASLRQQEADQNYDMALKKRMGEKSNWEKGGAAIGSVAGMLTAGGGTR